MPATLIRDGNQPAIKRRKVSDSARPMSCRFWSVKESSNTEHAFFGLFVFFFRLDRVSLYSTACGLKLYTNKNTTGDISLATTVSVRDLKLASAKDWMALYDAGNPKAPQRGQIFCLRCLEIVEERDAWGRRNAECLRSKKSFVTAWNSGARYSQVM
jgi:hypothetical protein